MPPSISESVIPAYIQDRFWTVWLFYLGELSQESVYGMDALIR